jgi:hypothetical protein
MVPECDTPSEVEGMWWGVIKDSAYSVTYSIMGTKLQATVKLKLKARTGTNMILSF